jgi:hypothetical protein
LVAEGFRPNCMIIGLSLNTYPFTRFCNHKHIKKYQYIITALGEYITKESKGV